MESRPVSAFDMLGRRWSALILRGLLDGSRRFRELRACVAPINDKVLAQRLREMEAAGIVQRRVFAEVPARVEYSLSEKGKGLSQVIREMERWDSLWAGRADPGRAEAIAHGVAVTIAGHIAGQQPHPVSPSAIHPSPSEMERGRGEAVRGL